MPHEVVLASVPLFSKLPKKDLTSLGKAIVERRYKKGNAIVTEGEPANAFYVIEHGKVEVTNGRGKKAAKLNELKDGAFFGEMAFLDGATRTATVRALEDTDCLVLPRKAFTQALRQNPRIAVAMLPVLISQFRQDARDAQPLFSLLRYI